MCVAPLSVNTSVITRCHAAYAFLCDTSIIIIVKNIVQEAAMTKNKHCDCAPLLNYFIHLLLRYDTIERIKHDLFIVLL